METGLESKDVRRYIYVLGSTGDIRESVLEGTEGAIKRKYETSDGKEGEKWELVYKSVGGTIVDVDLYEGDYGTQVQITLDFGEGENATLSLGTNTPFGEDVMKKLPNINYNEVAVFKPYNFTDENGKTRKGITITQGDVKIQNFFWDADKKEATNDLPQPKGDTSKYTKEKWVLYFATVRDFLVDYTRDNIVTKFKDAPVAPPEGDEEF